VGAAEGAGDVPPPHEVGGRAHPLVGPGDVVDQLTSPEEPAQDGVHGGQLPQLPGAGGRQRLVEQDQALLHPVGHEQQAAEKHQGLELDVGVAAAASDGDGVAEQRLARLRVRFGQGPDDGHPATLGSILAGLLEDGPSPGPPSALHRPLAEDVPGDPGQGAGRPAGGHALTLPAVGGVGALVVGRRRGVLALQVQRLGKAFQHLARFDLSQSGLEGTASGGGVASAQRRRPFLDQGRAHPPMMARPDVTEAART
jgi:hypothetical protein